jgi:hypothetical protein
VKTSDSDYRNAIMAIKVFAEANCAKQRLFDFEGGDITWQSQRKER